jgi:hypothetical protein
MGKLRRHFTIDSDVYNSAIRLKDIGINNKEKGICFKCFTGSESQFFAELIQLGLMQKLKEWEERKKTIIQ